MSGAFKCGHERTPANIYTVRRVGRSDYDRCRQCMNDYARRYQENDRKPLGLKGPAPVPADFAEQCKVLTKTQLEAHYKRTDKTIRRWLEKTGLTAAKPPKCIPPDRTRAVPDDWAEMAPRYTRNQLIQHYRTSDQVVARWERESGIKARRPVTGMRMPRGARLTVQARPSSIFDDAADVLRRFGAVYRCNEKGGADQKGKWWRVGWSVLTGDELLERAERKRSAA